MTAQHTALKLGCASSAEIKKLSAPLSREQSRNAALYLFKASGVIATVSRVQTTLFSFFFFFKLLFHLKSEWGTAGRQTERSHFGKKVLCLASF